METIANNLHESQFSDVEVIEFKPNFKIFKLSNQCQIKIPELFRSDFDIFVALLFCNIIRQIGCAILNLKILKLDSNSNLQNFIKLSLAQLKDSKNFELSY